jgi:hypothetical protein
MANTYRVKVVHEELNGMGNGTNRWPMITEVRAKSASEAIDKAITQLRDQGYAGMFRWPEAENTEDGHDYARRSF